MLEDRAEFEVVADVPPETVREKVFTRGRRVSPQAARRRPAGPPARRFRRDEVLDAVARELGVEPEQVAAALFADLKDENRLLRFEDLDAQRLIDRYNVALAQAVLLRSVLVTAEVRNEKPARYRQLFRQLKFHRLLYRVEGSMDDGYVFHIDGPLSLFSATTKYGLQMALFLPALLHCARLPARRRAALGPEARARGASTSSRATAWSRTRPTPARTSRPRSTAFVERFRQVAPAWEVSEATDVIELGREGVWVPDYRFVHKATGTDVFVEVLGFWKRSSLERLLRLLPRHGPPRYVLAISDRLKVDEEALERARRAGPPVQGDPQRPRAGRAARRLRARLRGVRYDGRGHMIRGLPMGKLRVFHGPKPSGAFPWQRLTTPILPQQPPRRSTWPSSRDGIPGMSLSPSAWPRNPGCARSRRAPACDLDALQREIQRAKERFSLPDEARR